MLTVEVTYQDIMDSKIPDAWLKFCLWHEIEYSNPNHFVKITLDEAREYGLLKDENADHI